MNIYINQEYDPSVRRDNYSKILFGNNDTVVILLHGFISSPFEVYFLGKKINEFGFTVYMPLIEGFGGSTELANRTKYKSWQSTLKNSIDLLSPCYSKIVLIGFSLGGTIVTDFLLNQNSQYPKLQGAVLLAPFYSPETCCGEFLNDFVGLFTDSIPLTTLYKLSANEDLKIPISNPDYYNSDMPLKAVKEVIKFGKELKTQKFSNKISLPTLFVYNENDKTVNNEVSLDIIKKNFSNLKDIKFSKGKKVMHQLAVPSGNEDFDIFSISIINFINDLTN